MSQHAEDEPIVRLRRQTVLPTCYDEYDLTGFTLPKPVTLPISPPIHSTRLAEGDEAEEGATGFTPLLPGYETDSPLQWSGDEHESASDIIRRENKDLCLVLQMIQERYTFQNANDQYGKEISQLKQQIKQLQIQMDKQCLENQPLHLLRLQGSIAPVILYLHHASSHRHVLWK